MGLGFVFGLCDDQGLLVRMIRVSASQRRSLEPNTHLDGATCSKTKDDLEHYDIRANPDGGTGFCEAPEQEAGTKGCDERSTE